MKKINIDSSFGSVINWAYRPANKRRVYRAIQDHCMDYHGSVLSGVLERGRDGTDHLRLDESLPVIGDLLPLPDHVNHSTINMALGTHCSAVFSRTCGVPHIALCVKSDLTSYELLIQDFITSNDITSVDELKEIISGNIFPRSGSCYPA